MKQYMSHSWKGVVVMLAVLVVFVVSAQAFALGSGADELRQVDTTSHVEPTAADQGDATFEVEPATSLLEINQKNMDHAGHLLDKGTDSGLLGASGHTGADALRTIEAARLKDVTLSARVRGSSGVTGTVDFTFEIKATPDVLDLPVGDVLAGVPATSPAQTVTLGEETSSIPEPTVLVLVGLGVIGLALLRRRWGRDPHA